MKMNDKIRQQTREWFRDNALACTAEVESGAVKLASHYPLELYRARNLVRAEEAMRGDYDHSFAFQQRAQWIAGIDAPALLPMYSRGEA